nr:hypothetical protein [uncultured bacterium]
MQQKKILSCRIAITQIDSRALQRVAESLSGISIALLARYLHQNKIILEVITSIHGYIVACCGPSRPQLPIQGDCNKS